MKRSPMRRTGWTRRKPAEPPAIVVFGGRMPGMATLRAKASMASISGPAPSIPKESAIRSEAYRRAVAELPCCLCGVQGHSQAAHPNTGKGFGIKTDDRLCFPLCADRPGTQGCHARFDQHALFDRDTRREMELEWVRQTQARIIAAGRWPPNLERTGGDFFYNNWMPND